MPALFKKCWKWILLSLILLLAVVYYCVQAGDKTAVNPNAVGNTLSTRDQFISQTYFSLLYYYPDPDESLELLQEHVQGQDLLGAGKYDEAVVLFKALVKKYPGARHANEGLAIALKERYNHNGDFKDLQASSEYFIKSIQKALEVNTVPVISLQVGADLGLLGETTKLNDIFQQLDRQFPENGQAALNYAQGLTAVDDPRAGEWFNKAVEQKAASAPSEYSEWLLDRQCYTDALITLDAALDLEADNMDLHFLKGYALECLGQKTEAEVEYDLIRQREAKTPAGGTTIIFKAKYRLAGSLLQRGLNFSQGIAQEDKRAIKIGNRYYEVSYPPELKGYFRAIATPLGIVWSPVPSMEGKDLGLHPASPYFLNLSPDTVTKLNPAQAQKILTLPLQMDSPRGNGKLDVSLGSLYAVNDWVIYSISLRARGANQPDISKLYALNLNNKKNTFITDFHDCGGGQFRFGFNGSTILCDQWTPGDDDPTEYTHQITIYNLETSRPKEVPAGEVTMQNEAYRYQGKVFTITYSSI